MATRKKMKRWFIAALLVVGLVIPWVNVLAQTPVEIQTLQVDIWPEYDKPDALVIYHLTIAASSTLPAQVSLRIPRQVNAPYSLAMKDVDGLLYNMKYDQSVDGDYIRVNFTAASTEIQLEYYDPSLVRDGSTRTYNFHWPGDYKVDNMSLHLQQPVNASGMQLSKTNLKMGAGVKAEDGLIYYTVPIDGSIAAGQSFDVAFTYNKPDTILSSSQAPVQPVRTVTGNAALATGLVTPVGNMIWIGLGLGLALVFIGILWYYSLQRVNSASLAANRRRRNSPPHFQQNAAVLTGETVYCHQCGKRAGPSDTFCRACGTKLRA
jgi:hypothetical protein